VDYKPEQFDKLPLEHIARYFSLRRPDLMEKIFIDLDSYRGMVPFNELEHVDQQLVDNPRKYYGVMTNVDARRAALKAKEYFFSLAEEGKISWPWAYRLWGRCCHKLGDNFDGVEGLFLSYISRNCGKVAVHENYNRDRFFHTVEEARRMILDEFIDEMNRARGRSNTSDD